MVETIGLFNRKNIKLKQEKNEIKNYAYIGTGNFNSKTAEIYCDHALFTADKKIGKELARVFDVLEGKLIIPRAKTLLISPFSTRLEFTRMTRYPSSFKALHACAPE
mgnify:CR=1 FL=1